MPTNRVQHIKPANLYLVRLWTQERAAGGNDGVHDSPEWQGQVQRVVDGEVRRFDSLQGLLDLLLQMLSGKAD